MRLRLAADFLHAGFEPGPPARARTSGFGYVRLLPVVTSLAWVTTAQARGHDVDEPIALQALARAGLAVEVVELDITLSAFNLEFLAQEVQDKTLMDLASVQDLLEDV